METKINWKDYHSLNIESADRLKDYVLCMFGLNHSVAIDSVFLIDRRSHHVYEYRAGNRASDITKLLLDSYNKNTIGDCVVDILLKKSDAHLGSLEFLHNTDDVLDMLDIVQDLRIYQAECVLRCAKRKYRPDVEHADSHFGIV